MLIAAGFAGALDPKLQLADIIMEEHDAKQVPRLISAETPVETPEAKARLFAASGAAAVDMESATLDRHWKTSGKPMISIRAISDVATQSLPLPLHVWFDIKRQRPRPGAILAYLARRPGQIRPFAAFVCGLGKVRRALALAIEARIFALEHD